MPHICMDEILLFMATVPFIKVLFVRAHQWWHLKYKHKCHTQDCDSVHPEHSQE